MASMTVIFVHLNLEAEELKEFRQAPIYMHFGYCLQTVQQQVFYFMFFVWEWIQKQK